MARPDEVAKAAILRDAMVAIVTGDTGDAEEMFTADVVTWSSTVLLRSRDELEAAMSERDDALSNLDVDVTVVHAAANCAIAEWRLGADHTGRLVIEDDLAVEPTGRHLTLAGATFAEFRDGRICNLRHYFDDAALLEQILVGDRAAPALQLS